MDEAKRQFVKNWLSVASRDLAAARTLSESSTPYLDVAIYHCQQAAEKAVKGFLIFHDQRFKKTHDIKKLAGAAQPFAESFEDWLTEAELLNPYIGKFRYIEDVGAALEPSREEFDKALNAATRFYNFVLSQLPKEVHP